MLQQIDVQNQRDARQVTIDKVGVKGVRYPILVEDRQNKVQHTVAELDILVELPHSHRGTHMSRFLEVLNKYQEETLIGALPDFLTDIKQALNADKAYVTFRFPYFFTDNSAVFPRAGISATPIPRIRHVFESTIMGILTGFSFD